MMQTSAVRRAGSGHGDAPLIIQGEGAKPGEVPTDENQSTGLERFELLGRLQGVDVFDMKPLDASRAGTVKDPIVVQSLVSCPPFGLFGRASMLIACLFVTVPVPCRRLHRLAFWFARHPLDTPAERARASQMP
jgi:hypothetical protein